jgi:hypothetical protein
MPQIFHLENFAEDEPVVKSNYGQGPDILGKAWNDTSVGAVAAFILSRAPEAKFPAVPVQGDAKRGREVFRVSGCLSCHNLAPYPNEVPKTVDLAFEKEGTNEHGPDLRGVATHSSGNHAAAKAIFLGGITRRFPQLRFGFLEGGRVVFFTGSQLSFEQKICGICDASKIRIVDLLVCFFC